MRKKILLVEPPFYRLYNADFVLAGFPLALGYLAGWLRQRTDWDVAAANADFAVLRRPFNLSHSYLAGEGFANYRAALRDPDAPIWREVADMLRREAPAVLGLSAKTQNFHAALRVARIAKALDPDMRVVLGGPHPTMTGATALSHPELDALVHGEGEETLAALLGVWENEGDPARVAGISFRDGERVRTTAPRPLMADLDALPFPHAVAPDVLLDYAAYPVSAFMNVFSARGCPFHCLYCGSRAIWTRRPRYRSVANVVAEMRGLEALGVPRINFDDDTFGISKRRIRELCQAILAAGLRTPWSCELHVNLVDDATLELMRRAGCALVFLGVESGNDAILRANRKHTTVAKALAACATVKRHDIQLYTFFMVGFPDETEATMAETLAAMRRADPDYIIHSIFTPYPGTEAFARCREMGLVDDAFDASRYNHQSPENNFTQAIPRERFRRLAGEIEAFVDAHNTAKAARRRQLREAGLGRQACA